MSERFSVLSIWLARLNFPKQLHPLFFVSDCLWMFHLCVALFSPFFGGFVVLFFLGFFIYVDAIWGFKVGGWFARAWGFGS